MEKVHDKLLVWGSEVDYQAREQASRASRLPFVPGHVALMPDAHVGMGATVGSVIPTEGAIVPSFAGVAQMLSQGYGRIVLTSSITGAVVGQPGYAHYGATKAALVGLMRSAALEVARSGVTINAVLPGNIRTPGFDELGPEHEKSMIGAIPLGRVGEPEDVGWAVRFLASPEAGYITGQTLIIDGGQVLPEGT